MVEPQGNSLGQELLTSDLYCCRAKWTYGRQSCALSWLSVGSQQFWVNLGIEVEELETRPHGHLFQR